MVTFKFSSLPLLSEQNDTRAAVKIHVNRSVAKPPVADQTLAYENCETALTTPKPQTNLSQKFENRDFLSALTAGHPPGIRR